MTENECAGCEYYDEEDGVCKAVECWPVMDCDAPLPCEEEEK